MAESEKNPQSDFMMEKIKERPVNKKKLLRRTVTTVAMAVIFGMIACVTFLTLEPVISNLLYPEEKPDAVIFPEEQEETAQTYNNAQTTQNSFGQLSMPLHFVFRQAGMSRIG